MNNLLSPLSFATPTIQAQSLANIGGFSSGGGTIAGNVVVSGNLTVQGTTVTIDSTVVNYENNILTLNSNTVGAPTTNAGILVNRGTSTNASLIWNETTKQWTAGLYGSEATLLTTAATVSGDVTGTLGSTVIGSSTVTTSKVANNAITYAKLQQASANTFLANSTGSTANLAEKPITAYGLSVVAMSSASALRSSLGTIGKYATTLGVSASTSATVTHNLGTTDISVSIININTNVISQATATVVDANNVTITFSSAIPANTWRVIVFG